MSLTPEQKQTVSTWVSAGDTLYAVQKKLAEQFKVSMTYMEVRFLVDDLGLELKNPVVAKPAEAMAPAADAASLPAEPAEAEPVTEEFADDLPPVGASKVSVDIDLIVRPGMVVSGSVTFSDGVTGKWALDQQGRLALDTGQKGYKPNAADIQAFQVELSLQLQKRGY